MQGLGKPGSHFIKMIEWGLFFDKGWMPMPTAIETPDVNAAGRGQRVMTAAVKRGMEKDGESLEHRWPDQFIPKTMIHDAILNPPLEWYGTTSAGWPRPDQFIKYKYPADGCSEIHMIWSDTPCLLTCWNDSNSMAKAYQSPRMTVSSPISSCPSIPSSRKRIFPRIILADSSLQPCTKTSVSNLKVSPRPIMK